MSMLAFHSDVNLKEMKLAQVRAHEAADEIVKGKYWERGKGCAVGCTIHGSNHAAYETEMGIPRMLARLEDCIFEGMSNEAAKRFPARFIAAIQPGADLSLVGWQFLHWLIVDVTERYGNEKTRPGVAAAIEVLRKKAAGEPVNASEACDARRQAEAAREAAWAAARAAEAAEAAAEAAWAAEAAREAAREAEAEAYDRQAEKLLELLAAAPVASIAA